MMDFKRLDFGMVGMGFGVVKNEKSINIIDALRWSSK